ncbi:MAG: aminotransferase class I/II-fold pyridoxal phosphate-dependent enzyme [Paramuribaculum sp.]|nr:aminotransferase class I/II-fold pyridoxal phosphate-dependent enzyme [Paramuribaculum sp.]
MIEGHGDDLYRYENKIKFNFSSNIYQGFKYDRLKEYLYRQEDNIFSSYPEPIPHSLERLIAEAAGFSHEEVMVTSGSTDSIYNIAFFRHSSDSTIVEPTFSEYEDACLIHKHKIKYISQKQFEDRKVFKSQVVWLCNPNNPTGRVYNKNLLEEKIKSNPDVLFVIDAAYKDYTLEEMPDFVRLVKTHKILVLFSFTKRFAIPGLRIGYIAGRKDLINKLKSLRMPWSVSSVSLTCCEFLMKNKRDYVIPIISLLYEKQKMTKSLRELGIKVLESDTNFILCRLPLGRACDLKEYLAETHGLLIRDAANFHGLDESYFRIASQGNFENNLLIKAVQEWLVL